MAARKKADLAKMTPEEREKYEQRLAKAREPKPAYLLYTVNPDSKTITIHDSTRDAEELLGAKDANPDWQYGRFMIK
jgi:hypothetical protein